MTVVIQLLLIMINMMVMRLTRMKLIIMTMNLPICCAITNQKNNCHYHHVTNTALSSSLSIIIESTEVNRNQHFCNIKAAAKPK